MSHRNGIRHIFGSLVGSISEHHTLISGTYIIGICLCIAYIDLFLFFYSLTEA